MKTHHATAQPRFRSRKGAALLVAVILGAAIALALGTFVYIANSELRMASRTGQMTMVNNVAEAGLEELFAALNTQTAQTALYPSTDPLTARYVRLSTTCGDAGGRSKLPNGLTSRSPLPKTPATT